MQNGRMQFTDAMRAKEMMFCPVGAMAMFLVTRFDLVRKEIPNFGSRRQWYATSLKKYVITESHSN